MNRRIIGAVAALLLAAMGTFVLLAYVRTAEDRALAGEQIVEVLVVEEEIAAGTSGDELQGLVRMKKVPAKVEADASVAAVSELTGKVAAVDLVAGEQVLSTRFVSPEKLEAQGAVDVPEGLHQVTVSLEPQRALGGQVKPGDTVGVVASFEPSVSPHSSHLILHKVLVTNVQGAATAPSSDPAADANTAVTDNVLVTLAVDAPSVERLVFSAEHGFVWLSNEPDDAPERGTSVQTRGTVYEK